MPSSPKAARPRTVASEQRLSRQRRPGDLPVEAWQTGLRRQFGREQAFELKRLGSEPVFSEYALSNRSPIRPPRLRRGSNAIRRAAAPT